MPRTARVSLAGGVFHVVSRFVREEWLLDEEGARDAYLRAVEHAAKPDDARVLAYCLMSSHVHLVLIQRTVPLSRFLKSVHTSFADFVNRGRGSGAAQGPVFAGRPRMVLVESDAHLLELVRYVHNNPVRGRVVGFARDSEWSSHRAYIGWCDGPEWLGKEYVLGRFGGAHARTRFDAFVNARRNQGRRLDWSGERDQGEAAKVRSVLGDGHRRSDGVLGGAALVERVDHDGARVCLALGARDALHRSGPVGRPALREVVDAVLAHLRIDPITFEERPRTRACTQARRLITWLWVHEFAGQQIEVARALNMETGAVCRLYRDALSLAGDFDEAASAVVALLARRAKPRSRTKTRPTADGQAVRYFVDLDET